MPTTRTTGGTTSDWSLLRRIALNEEALPALYDRYSGLVFSVAKRIVHRTGEAEEILQDVFYRVWRTAERFDQAKGSLAGWLPPEIARCRSCTAKADPRRSLTRMAWP